MKTGVSIMEKYLEIVTQDENGSDDGNTLYTCKACADYFEDYYDFKLHVQQAHTNSAFLNCEICKKFCLNMKALTMHKNLAHKGERNCLKKA
jgi:uncharacterized C2H2 Zn-finger protein